MKKFYRIFISFLLIFFITACTDYEAIYSEGLNSINTNQFSVLNERLLELESGDIFLYDQLIDELEQYVYDEVDAYLLENDFDSAFAFLTRIKDEISGYSLSSYNSLTNQIKTQQEAYELQILSAEIVNLVNAEKFLDALLKLDDAPNNLRIDGLSKEEYSIEILSFLVADVYVHYWNSSSISDLNSMEDELEYILDSLSDREAYLLAYDMIDLQWHKQNFDINEIFIDSYVRKLLPDYYDELLSRNEEMSLDAEVPSTVDLASYLEPRSAIVNVYIGARKTGTGSAFFINDRGLLLSNYHVVENGNRFQVVTGDGRTHDVSIIFYDEIRDLVLLKAPIRDNEYVNLSSSYYVETGDTIYTYGSPLGITNTITEGIVSKNLSIINGQEFIQISAPISPGSSGGMLLNKYGDVIGITTAYLVDGQNMNLAIPINRAINLIHLSDSSIELGFGGDSHIIDITPSTIRKIHQYFYDNNEDDEFFGFLDNKGDYVYGIIQYKNGDSFEGELNSERYATGKGAAFGSNYMYYGDFFNGYRDGNGEFYFDDGDFYIGQFKMGDFHGTGSYYWGSENSEQFGHVYIGEWENSSRTGYGIYLWPDGGIYQGEFIEGSRTGQGEFFDSEIYYNGGWVDDLWNGEGELVDEFGGYYVGGFLNGQFHGQGDYLFSNGVFHTGVFVSGRPFGQGTRIYRNDDMFVATWTDWDSGVGMYYWNNGDSEYSTLRNGVWD